MKTRKRILAGLLASLFLTGSLPQAAAAGTGTAAADSTLSAISVANLGNLEEICSGEYLRAYQVPVSSYECVGGESNTSLSLQNAFDNDWMTYWQAADKTKVSSITVTFNEISTVSRIIYGLREVGSYGDGYPTHLKIAVSRSDSGEDFTETAAGRSEMSKDKMLFTLEEPVEAKRIRFIFAETYDSYPTPNPDYGAFATAAELKFLRPDPIFETVSDLFEDEDARQLKEKYRNDEILQDLEAQTEGHAVRGYLLAKIRLAQQLVTGETTPHDPLDFPVEVIQKTGPDSENYVMLFVPDRYTIDQQDDFIKHTKSLIDQMMKDYNIYKRYGSKINIYALKVPSNQSVSGTAERSFVLDSYFKSSLDNSGLEIGTNLMPDGRDKLFGLVDQLEENYLDPGGKVSVAHIVLNSNQYAGRALDIYGKVPISMSTAYLSTVMVHELSHAAGVLGDEYVSNHTIQAPNVTAQTDPHQSPWKEFLGFRSVCHYEIQQGLYRPAKDCMMADMTSDFCEYCKLLLAEKLNKQMDLYIAKPIPVIHDYYTQYPGDGTEITPSNIASVNNHQIEYRTIIKNYGETDRNVTLTMYIIGKDGTKKVEKSEDFTLPASQIKSIKVVSDTCKGLKYGDRVTGRLVDKTTGTVLVDGDTYLNKYGTVTIKCRVGDENNKTDNKLPNVSDHVLYLEANSTYELNPANINGYEYTGKSLEESSVQITENGNIDVTYYYTMDKGKITLNLTDENNTVVKEIYRYVGRGETFTPAQSDFPAKEGHRLVLPESVVFDGINDITLTYSYEEGEPEPEPIRPQAPEIPAENIITEEVTQGSTVDLRDNISNLPAGASVTVIKNVSTDAVGRFTGRVKVTFADGTFREVNIPVIVRAAAPVDPAPADPQPVDPAPADPQPVKPAPTVLPFTDIETTAGNWKYENVKYVYENNIMNGISGTTQFQPDSPLTRSMFATVLYRMAGSPSIVYTDKFPDVADGKWYSEAILWANKEGIVNGFSDGSYGINVNITREQIAKMLFEYAKKQGYDTSISSSLENNSLEKFTDADKVNEWAQSYMQWAAAVGMISGKPNGDGTYRLDPKGEATRAECAAMLTRFEKNYK
ncbi:MAG: S-layer homology domain-containing protein [Lachnospiraceae bacterium]|nr:S-layer homology domain-containing protein [Lachnospiraceae bacterium]